MANKKDATRWKKTAIGIDLMTGETKTNAPGGRAKANEDLRVTKQSSSDTNLNVRILCWNIFSNGNS